MPAAKASLAAGNQGKFWEMQELLFKNSKKLEDADLEGYAGQLELDMEQYKKDYQSDTVMKLIQDDFAVAKKIDVRGTPTLFLNGKRVQGQDRNF